MKNARNVGKVFFKWGGGGGELVFSKVIVELPHPSPVSLLSL